MLPEKRLPMRHTREILRLHFESHLAPRQIAKICKVAKSTVQRYLERLKAAGLSWPLPSDLDDVSAGAVLISATSGRVARGALPAGLRGDSSGTEEPQERNPSTSVGRVQAGESARLRLQLVLRALPRMAAPT